jgi:hypothetical protein
LGAGGSVAQGDQISFLQKSPKRLPNPYFVRINAQLVPWKKVIQKLARLELLINYLYNKKLPKVNCLLGENSPNPVTLERHHFLSDADLFFGRNSEPKFGAGKNLKETKVVGCGSAEDWRENKRKPKRSQAWSQSHDLELLRQRCKHLQRN